MRRKDLNARLSFANIANLMIGEISMLRMRRRIEDGSKKKEKMVMLWKEEEK